MITGWQRLAGISGDGLVQLPAGKQSCLELVAQDPVQMALGYVQSGRIHKFLGMFAGTFPVSSSWICQLNVS